MFDLHMHVNVQSSVTSSPASSPTTTTEPPLKKRFTAKQWAAIISGLTGLVGAIAWAILSR